MIAFVEPPMAMSTVIAFSNASFVSRSEGFTSSHASSTMRRPVSVASRDGLVASPHEHDAVDRMTANDFLRLHRQHVAIEHRRGFHEHFAERHDRYFDGEAARLPGAAFYFLGSLAEMRMARVEIGPRV